MLIPGHSFRRLLPQNLGCKPTSRLRLGTSGAFLARRDEYYRGQYGGHPPPPPPVDIHRRNRAGVGEPSSLWDSEPALTLPRGDTPRFAEPSSLRVDHNMRQPSNDTRTNLEFTPRPSRNDRVDEPRGRGVPQFLHTNEAYQPSGYPPQSLPQVGRVLSPQPIHPIPMMSPAQPAVTRACVHPEFNPRFYS